jgi:hypothetical protein
MSKKNQSTPDEAKAVYTEWAKAIAVEADLSSEQSNRVIAALLEMPASHYVHENYIQALGAERMNEEAALIKRQLQATIAGDATAAAEIQATIEARRKEDITWRPPEPA